ncbi:head-tail adaptor protein [Aquicoccus sp. G2-2]|uniref:head-tail adaptor protein n=1 Tax=Aquicoccus sp. G2-2 TaxID=3092120 RepID=UPI002AE04519|nr:head-tail adaptor protein [Aquicoccus sp. G2-2]MEA1112757.1 head-tail adaptor protein [Aquicoccus sp. G2-2]
MKVVTLNRRLVLEAPERLPDGAGGFSEGWTMLGTLWAQVDARTGREKQGEAVPVSNVGYRITLRAAPVGHSMRPQPDQRLRDGTRVFRILAVAEAAPDGRYLTCFAEEEVAV